MKFLIVVFYYLKPYFSVAVSYPLFNHLSFIQIYVSLEGVTEENVTSKFEDWTCEVKIHNVEGKNYRFLIQKLHKVIDPDACRIIIKPKRIIISLRKLEEEDWKELYFKEDKVEVTYEYCICSNGFIISVLLLS